ncbi:MAG: hypothetical protein AAF318_13415 [Pseudomonadota bacterium]
MMPLAPGRLFINPNFVDPERLPAALKTWELLIPPRPKNKPIALHGFMSNGIAFNVLSLDEKRIPVEREETDFIAALKDWGFEPIPRRFKEHYPFIGGFHCTTLDIAREGPLEDYS